jgi:hypothetical protein
MLPFNSGGLWGSSQRRGTDGIVAMRSSSSHRQPSVATSNLPHKQHMGLSPSITTTLLGVVDVLRIPLKVRQRTHTHTHTPPHVTRVQKN